MNGPNAEIVDQILEGAVPAASKRSRPTSVSSLDYQVRAKRDQLTTTKPGKRKTQQQQQQPDHHQQYRRSISTRARGSSGPPPRRFDLSDLEGMDEDQLLQALYEDPELADAAAKAAEEAKKQKRSTRKFSSSTTTPPKEQYYRAADGSVKDVGQYPEHLREMIDGGVPVTQWIVLLVLLCAGLYQLRKAVLGVSTSPVKTRSADKGKTKTSKQQRKVKNKDEKPPASNVKDSTQVTPPSLPPPQKKAIPTPAPAEKQNAKNKKKTKGASSDKKKKEDTVQQQPDNDSTGESSTPETNIAERDTFTTKTTSVPSHTETADEDDEWQTVTKSRTAVTSEPKTQEAKSSEQDSQELPDEGMPELVNAEQETKEDVTETNSPAASQTEESDTTNKKSKKQPKQQEKKQSSSGSREVFSDDDAALALKLHKEEETLAQGASAPDQEETWEEVSGKKYKSKGAPEW